MKTIVITGSGRGLGFELATRFRKADYNVVLNDINEAQLENAKTALESVKGAGGVFACVGDVSSLDSMRNLCEFAVKNCGSIDIWINNAGINQPMKAIWELSETEIRLVLDVDLKGAVYGSKAAMEQMIAQGHGAIYNMEGYGSNDAMMLGLNMYGTSKRAVTHLTKALAKESEERSTGVIVGRLSPGIMITDFTTGALGGKEKIDLPEKTKKVYNILGDYPNVVADFLVKEMLTNTKNDAHIEWLTGGKAAWRFMTAAFNKRDFFAEK